MKRLVLALALMGVTFQSAFASAATPSEQAVRCTIVLDAMPRVKILRKAIADGNTLAIEGLVAEVGVPILSAGLIIGLYGKLGWLAKSAFVSGAFTSAFAGDMARNTGERIKASYLRDLDETYAKLEESAPGCTSLLKNFVE